MRTLLGAAGMVVATVYPSPAQSPLDIQGTFTFEQYSMTQAGAVVGCAYEYGVASKDVIYSQGKNIAVAGSLGTLYEKGKEPALFFKINAQELYIISGQLITKPIPIHYAWISVGNKSFAKNEIHTFQCEKESLCMNYADADVMSTLSEPLLKGEIVLHFNRLPNGLDIDVPLKASPQVGIGEFRQAITKQAACIRELVKRFRAQD